MRWYFCLLIAEDFWQKPDALVRCSQEFQLKAIFFFAADTVSLKFLTHNSTVLRLGTLVPMNIEVPTKYLLSHNDRIVFEIHRIVFEIHLHSESAMLYKPALHGNWNALSLTRRALKDKFPTPTVPLTAVLPNRQIFLPDPVLDRKV